MASTREQSLSLCKSNRQKNKLNSILILSILGLGLLTSCQQITELRVIMSGSPIPRNYREQTIFDYFHALRDKRCQDAYELRAYPQTSEYYDYATKSCMSSKVESLPVVISIGEERKLSYSRESCGYHYIVYVAYPDSTQLTSGEVTLVNHPRKPGQCQVGYNSAFGDP
uniref:Uncharacterized protein n=1 Tax=Cyanothece sp. (strain PCC 7425 / ATCC 29141) TaxID=395961 RepID=B8HPR7_CYAP4